MQSKKILNKTVLQVVFMNVQCNASLSWHWRVASVCEGNYVCVGVWKQHYASIGKAQTTVIICAPFYMMVTNTMQRTYEIQLPHNIFHQTTWHKISLGTNIPLSSPFDTILCTYTGSILLVLIPVQRTIQTHKATTTDVCPMPVINLVITTTLHTHIWLTASTGPYSTTWLISASLTL